MSEEATTTDVLNIPRFAAAAVAGTLGTAVVTGVPTELIANPWFTRMTPVRPLDVVFWVLLAPLTGLLIATYVAGARRAGRDGAAAGTLTVFAIGCPVCNKLVVALAGTSGALTWFAPLQPVLGALAVGLAVWALRVRLGALRPACPAPAPPEGAVAGSAT